MAYLGGHQLGDVITLLLWSRTLAKVPTAPDAAPSVEVWSGAALIQTLSLPAFPGSDGKMFLYNLFLGDTDYAVGKYYLHYEWVIGGTILTKMDVMEIVAGGDSDGTGISMHFTRQTAADYVLLQGRAGRVLRLKNPSL